MDTQDETKLAYRDYCNYVLQAAYHILVNAVKPGHPRFRGVGQGFLLPLSDCNWLTEPEGSWLKVKIPKSHEEETIQVAIGAREGWKPVVSVASSSRDPVTIESVGDAKADVEQVKREIGKCLQRLGL